jgi:AGZA family xanthine/uracil permease-like MFS transporter
MCLPTHVQLFNSFFDTSSVQLTFIHLLPRSFPRAQLAGATATFLTMAYILAVNPRILADSGGPCVPDPPEEGGIFGANYEACLEEIKRQYITATAIGSMVGCLIMGIFANLPIALAPGMGMNAYFTYSVVGWRGTGSVSFQAAVTAVIIEGAIFFVLAITGARYAIIRLIPEPVRIATPVCCSVFVVYIRARIDLCPRPHVILTFFHYAFP